MGKTVVVAEKPSVARDIARVLGAGNRGEGFFEGNGYAVSWAFGHLYTQLNPDEIDPRWKSWRRDNLPILPEVIPLKALPKTRSQLSTLKKLMNAKDTDRVICATDAGREGELIFRRIAQELKVQKPVFRLWISSLTDEAIRAGFANLRPAAEYDALYQSALCRAEADWLVGMNGSRAYTVRYDALLSVGRVQTPTLAVLVKRRQEIERFVPETYFEVEADFAAYKGLWIDEKAQSRIAEEQKARAIVAAVKGKEATVDIARREEKRVPPPYLYDLTALQRDANRRHGLTAENTLKAAQSLYEKHKALTYPRTDSPCLPRDMAGPAKAALRALSGPYAELAALVPEQLPLTRRVFDDSRVSDHHAIIPTRKPPGSLTGPEAAVYDLVVRRFIAAFLPDYRYEAMRVETLCAGHRFLSQGARPLELGWKMAYGGEDDDEKGKEKQPPLPDLSTGDRFTTIGAKARKKQTKPPAPHTEASLLAAMEHAGREIEDENLRVAMKDAGLGTPATRAAIIERLIEVQYAARKGRALHATDKGVSLVAVVPPELSSPETTGRWEKGLADIRAGRMDPARFMGSIRRFAAFLCERATSAQGESPFPKEERRAAKVPAHYVKGAVCPLCGGKVTTSPKAFGCANWRTAGCKFTVWRDTAQRAGGPELTEALFAQLMRQGRLDVPEGTFNMRDGRAYFQKK